MAFWNIHQLRMERNYQKNGILIILLQLYLIGGLEHGSYDFPYWERSSHLTFIFFRGAGIPTRYTLNIFDMFSIDLFFLPIQDRRVVNPLLPAGMAKCMAYFSHMLR